MDTQRNEVLADLLREFGYSHDGLAREVNKISARMFRKAGVATDRHVRRWLSGEVRWPNERYLLPLMELFDRAPEQLGFVPRGRSTNRLPVPPPVPGPGVGEEDAAVQRRREFMMTSTGATVALVLGLEETPVTGRLALSDVDRIQGKIGRLAAHFTAIGGGALFPVAAGYLDRLRRTADGCTYGPRVEQALNAAISDLCSSAGWSALDAGEPGQARLMYADALQSAILAGDRRGQARAWSNLAMQARVDGRLRESLRINRAALESKQARQDPLIAALLHARLAIGHARAKDRPAAARSILAAERAYDRADGTTPPTWLRFLDGAELAGLAAIAHQALGRLPDAEIATAQALELLAPSMRRSRAFYAVQLAELQVAQGHLDRAATTVADIDTGVLSSQRITERLAVVHRTLATT